MAFAIGSLQMRCVSQAARGTVDCACPRLRAIDLLESLLRQYLDLHRSSAVNCRYRLATPTGLSLALTAGRGPEACPRRTRRARSLGSVCFGRTLRAMSD